MDSRKIALHETAIVAAGVTICAAAMVGVFALLGRYQLDVLLGAAAGSLLAVGNFFAMAVIATLAADRAEAQDVEGGKKLLQASYPIRMLCLMAALVICAKSGYFNVVALVLPLAFVRPTITLAEFFRK